LKFFFEFFWGFYLPNSAITATDRAILYRGWWGSI